MSALSIQVPFPVFQDRDGQPLDNGYVWIGTANLNPQTNPVATYYDAALTIAAVQPLRTLNGFISRAGTPAQVYVDGVSFSILVQDSKGSMVYNFSDGTGISPNAASIVYDPAGTGAVATTVQDKLRETVSVKDFGAVGNGTIDDTTAIQAALNTSYDVYVPIGTYLISSTISVPAHTKLHFAGGLGNTSGSYPSAYFIKKSTMTTVGISIASTGWVSGGGLICQTGNTGDGVLLAGNNAKLSNFLVDGAGNDGVRIGTGVAGQNTNSCELDHVTSQYNGRHGILLDDGTGVAGSNTNCCTLIQPFCQLNGGDGIQIKEGFWNTIINPLCEVNSGWGIYLSGVDNHGVPSCRQTQIIGGDSEGNTLGNYWDDSYYSNWYGPTSTITLGSTGFYGNTFDPTNNLVRGLSSNGLITATLNAEPTTQYPIVVEHKSTSANGRGTGILFKTPAGTSTNISRDGVRIKAENTTGNYDVLTFSCNLNGTVTDIVTIDPLTALPSLYPATDNGANCGWSSRRWATVYAVTGTINTSDANQKQDAANLTAAEQAVAKSLKGLIKTFKLRDAVAKKGNEARIHVGVYAQELQQAFLDQGLDASKYAMFCSDTWTDDDGVEHTQLGVRYDQLLAFIISVM
jgi:hypothetical protein